MEHYILLKIRPSVVTHSVGSLLWLLSQASLSRTNLNTDSVVFTRAVTPRDAVFHVVWYCEEEHRHYMSYIRSFSFMEPLKIQACHNTIKDILDYGLEVRQPVIRNALRHLFPFPELGKSLDLLVLLRRQLIHSLVTMEGLGKFNEGSR